MKTGKDKCRLPALPPLAGDPELVMEEDSDCVIGNYYIKIGLSQSQVKALTQLGKKWNVKKSPCAVMARHIIALAILNPEVIDATLSAYEHGRKAGKCFSTLGSFCEFHPRNIGKN